MAAVLLGLTAYELATLGVGAAISVFGMVGAYFSDKRAATRRQKMKDAETEEKAQEIIKAMQDELDLSNRQTKEFENAVKHADIEKKRKQEIIDNLKKNFGQTAAEQYQKCFPLPKYLIKHTKDNPSSYYVQIIGSRGVGKSSFINKVLTKLNISEMKAATGVEETTIKPEFFDITSALNDLPVGFKKVFLVDMPGIGGLKITSAGYFAKFGPGNYHMTFMLMSDNGFNELEKYLLKHLIHNERTVSLIKTKMDSSVNGLIDSDNIEFNEALEKIQQETRKKLDDELKKQLEIFFVGIPMKNYDDWNIISNKIKFELREKLLLKLQ